MVPHADNPLFICLLLLLLKYGDRSFVLNRRNTDQHNVGYVQCTCSPNYRLEPKCSKEARVKKKSEQKLNLQAMNKLVFYCSLYFKFTNFFWFTCTNPLQDI